MNSPAYTGKCGQYRCGHAKSSHKDGGPCSVGHKFGQDPCQCLSYEPVVDQEKFNSVDGKPPVELYEFQKRYLQGLPSKYIFAADTGTGKTFMALAHYDKLAYLKPLLILAPASKVNTGDWQRDIEHYFAGRLVPDFQVVSYEKFSRIPTTAQYRKNGSVGMLREFLAAHKDGEYALIADEVHRAKNPQSFTGKAVMQVAQASGFFVGLSATPLPNGWIDAVNYYKIFGLVKNISEFKKRYCEYQTYKGFPELVRYLREDELQRYWNQIAKPLSKDQALDLPPVVSVPITLVSGPNYVKVQKERMFGDKFLDNPSALTHALRQSIIEPKVKWLDEFLEGASDNVIIFYNYKSEREAILAMIKKSHKGRQVFRQDGDKHEVPDKQQWSQLHRTVTLAQYQSGSTGIELTYGATTIYFSPTYSYSNYEQSIGRTNRHGQTRKMTMYLLCAPTTLEKDVWTALRNKSDFQASQWAEENIPWYALKDKKSLQNADEPITLNPNDIY